MDKLTKKPVLHLLKEVGLSDFEIRHNLQHADFFYFNIPTILNSSVAKQPLPRFTTENFHQRQDCSILTLYVQIKRNYLGVLIQ